MFPNAPLERQKDHGRAEACLIGAWYLQHRCGVFLKAERVQDLLSSAA
jgi:hypothetical protein